MKCVWLALVCVSIASLSQHAAAQTHLVELIHASEVVVETDSINGTVRRLAGDVRLRQDTISMRSQRATHYVDQGEVYLDGTVRIIAGDDTLDAQRVTYDADLKIATANGNVRISDGESVLTAPSATYYSREKRAVFYEGGTILHEDAELTAPSGEYDTDRKFAILEGPVQLKDSTSVLTAAHGTYDAHTERADFSGDVRLSQDDMRLEADSVSHLRTDEISRAFGRVVLERLGEAEEDVETDTTLRTLLFGNIGSHDGNDRHSSVHGEAGYDPLLIQLRIDSTGTIDSTFVRAARFDAVQLDTLNQTITTVAAVERVRLSRARFSAVADSVSFVRVEQTNVADAPPSDTLYLFAETRPSIWFEDSQVTGDTLVAQAEAGSIQQLDAYGNTFAAQFDTTLGRVRQLRGIRMKASFENDSLRTLSVWPNAEAIHFRATPEGLLDGADRLLADSLVFTFEQGRLSEVFGARGIEGVTYGPQIIPNPFQLSGYRFTPDERPTRESVLGSQSWEIEWLLGHPLFEKSSDITAAEVLPPAAVEDGDVPD